MPDTISDPPCIFETALSLDSLLNGVIYDHFISAELITVA